MTRKEKRQRRRAVMTLWRAYDLHQWGRRVEAYIHILSVIDYAVKEEPDGEG